MKKIEFKKFNYLKISPGDLKSGALLRCDIFVYLERNNKMIKVREQFSEFDSNTLNNYSNRKIDNLYILDPKDHPESYSLANAEKLGLNPLLPEGYYKAIPPSSEGSILDAPPAEAFSEGKILEARADADMPKPAEPLILKKEETESLLDGLQQDEIQSIEQEHTEKSIASNDPTPEIQTKFSPSEKDEPVEQTFSASEKEEESEQRFAKSENEKEAEQKFKNAREKKDTSEQTFGASEKEEESERRFSKSEKEKEAEQKFKNAQEKKDTTEQTFQHSEEEEQETRISPWQSKDDKEIKRIGKDVESLEEEFSKFSPDAKEFVEEMKFEAQEEEKKPSNWRTTLSDDSPKLKGLEKHDAAAVKLSHSLGKHLTKLRSELNDNSSMTPDQNTSPQQLQERKDAIAKAIEQSEVLFVLMESLDDEEMEISDLPKDFQSKSKQELLKFVENSVKDLKGSLLLSEEDSAQVQKKVEMVKAKKFSIYGDTIESGKQNLLEKIREARKEGKPFSPNELSDINTGLQEQYIAAAASVNITKKIIETKKELTELIAKSNASFRRDIKDDEKAANLQETIRELESLAFSIESGGKLDKVKISAYIEAPPPEFFFSADAEPELEIIKISTTLDKLKEELIVQKMQAEKSEEELMSQINGNEASENELKEKAEEAEIINLVSGADGKILQGGVYAATFFRGLGYNNKVLERNLLLAAYLFDFPEEQIKNSFPKEVVDMYQVSHSIEPTDEIFAQDIALAIAMGRKYNQTPGVITGKFSVDPNLFERFSEDFKKSSEVDSMTLERIRQRANIGLTNRERGELISLAKEVTNEVNKWKQKNSA